MRKVKGLTLIELAIILIIIGIFMGIGMSAFLIYTKNVKTSITKSTVQNACEAVKGYISTHYLIPSNLDSLGIKTTDAYQENLIYKINTTANDYTTNNLCSQSTSTDNTLTINIYSDSTTISSTKNNVVFAIYSKGENRVDNTNPDGDNTLDIKPYGVDNYDDIICYYDINSLRKDLCPLPLTVSGNLPTATEDKYYEASINVDGGQPPYSYSWSGLSCGLTANNDKVYGQVDCDTSSTDGKLSGCSQTLNLSVTVTDSLNPSPSNETTANFDLVVKAQPPYVFETILPDATECISYTTSLTGKGGNGSYTWNISGLPTGLSASGNTISGTPSYGTAGTYRVSVELSSCETITTQIPLKVNPNPVNIENQTLPAGYENQSYQLALTATGGSGSYNWTSATWDLDGDSDNDLVLTSTGVLEANQDDPSDPSTKVLDVPAGIYTITVQVCDASSVCSSNCQIKTYRLNVLSSSSGGGGGGGGGGSCSTPVSISGVLSNPQQCASYLGTLTISGGLAPYNCSRSSGTLPPNLSVSSSGNLCIISGNVEANTNSYSFTITASDSCVPANSDNYSTNLNINGFNILNNTGITLYYKLNGGSCTAWGNGRSIILNVGDTIDVFFSSVCTNQIYRLETSTCTGSCPSTRCTYFWFWGIWLCSSQTCVLGVNDSNENGLLELNATYSTNRYDFSVDDR